MSHLYHQEEPFNKALSKMRMIHSEMASTLQQLSMGTSTRIWDEAFDQAADEATEAFQSTIHHLDDYRYGSEDT